MDVNDEITVDTVENTDNSDLEVQEPENNTDNSTSDVQEPENNTDNDNKQGKFKTLEEAITAHSELEKKLGENSKELGELRKQKAEFERFKEKQLELARNYGFNSIEEFEEHQQEEQINKDLAAFEADEYLKHINECQEPSEMKEVLLKYRQNPSKELLDFIEAEFPLETIKSIAGMKKLVEGQLQNKKLEAQKLQVMNSAKEYLDLNVNKYSEDFKNPAFTELYSEAFRILGTGLNTDKFVNMLKNYANSVLKSSNLKNGIIKEGEDITDEIAGLSIGSASTSTEKQINNMSDKELESYIKKFV